MFFEFSTSEIKENTVNILALKHQNQLNKNIINNLKLYIVLISENKVKIFDTQFNSDSISFFIPKMDDSFTPEKNQIIGSLNNETPAIRLSSIIKI